jgi:kumamolisin
LRSKPQGNPVGDLSSAEPIDVTFWLKEKPVVGPKGKTLKDEAHRIMSLPLRKREYYDRKKFERTFRADPKALRAVLKFAERHKLTIQPSAGGERMIKLRISPDQVESLFNTKLQNYQTIDGKSQFRGRFGEIGLPADDFAKEAAKGVVGVFGLDSRLQGSSTLLDSSAFEDGEVALDAVGGLPYPPSLYQFESNMPEVPGPQPSTPPMIGVLSMGIDLNNTWPSVQQQFPGCNLTKVQASPISALKPPGADNELTADLWIIFQCIRDARVVVFGTDATEQGWLDALNAVLQYDPIPSVLNVSFGWPEQSRCAGTAIWTDAAFCAIEASFQALVVRGVTVCVASGDGGGIPSYPGTSAYVLSCGGTTFTTAEGITEQVWQDGNLASGGGVSSEILIPDWQTNSPIVANGYPAVAKPYLYRLFPDVAAFATFTQMSNTAGTSCAAPLWASALAIANRDLAAAQLQLTGNITQLLYALDPSLRDSCIDVLKGTNSSYPGSPIFSAGPCWDACTGWGTPDVRKLRAALLALAQPE